VVALATALAHSAAPAGAGASSGIESVVVLGDSVASGEGTLDGFLYQPRPLLPAWSAASRPRAYDRPHPDCHQSTRAYGRLVARALGARDTMLACSGASFRNGILEPPLSTARTLGPAQFGDWSNGRSLNVRYDDARPDLVLITAGANDVGFERAYVYCVLASRGFSDAEAGRVAGSASIVDGLVYAVNSAYRRVTSPTAPATAPVCTAGNPGSYLERTVLDRLPTVEADARSLAQAIRERGEQVGRVPEVIFTTYPNPLPAVAQSFLTCPDAAALGSAQVEFMNRLFLQSNAALREAVDDVGGAHVVELDPAFAGHRWCDRDPWVYGPSILVTNPTSWAPFHPTAAGQRAIADRVLAMLRSGDSTVI
jgi:lysophospholipase L1-like esterase